MNSQAFSNQVQQLPNLLLSVRSLTSHSPVPSSGKSQASCYCIHDISSQPFTDHFLCVLALGQAHIGKIPPTRLTVSREDVELPTHGKLRHFLNDKYCRVRPAPGTAVHVL